MKENFKNSSQEITWVDVRDSALMVTLGIHPRPAIPRDPSIWTKSEREKEVLRKIRHKEKFGKCRKPVKVTPIYAKLIIYLKKNKRFPNTTYSIICGLHQIGDILYYFNSKGSIVSKYFYNGKTYKPEERPFW